MINDLATEMIHEFHVGYSLYQDSCARRLVPVLLNELMVMFRRHKGIERSLYDFV